MTRTVILVCALMIVIILPSVADDNRDCKFGLHVVTYGTTSCKATKLPVITDTLDLDRDWDTYQSIDVWLVVFDYDSVTNVEFGVTWPSAWGTSYYTIACGADLSIGDIKNPGDGLSLSWTTCQRPGVQQLTPWPVAFFDLTPTSDGHIELTTNPTTHGWGLVNCGPEGGRFQHPPNITFNACVGIGCEPRRPTDPTTWGAIKAMFR